MIIGNFVIFDIFEQALFQDQVISVGKGYKFSRFSLSATGQTLDILLAKHDCQSFLPSM